MATKNLATQDKTDKPVAQTRELLNPFTAFRQEMDRIMDDFLGGFDLRPFSVRPDTFTPRIDVVDADKEVKISAELPGMEDKDIEVLLTGDVLTIKGEKKEEREEKGKDYYRSERSYGSFVRTISLPIEVDTASVEASFKKGVLTISLPKTARAVGSAKKISIRTE
jgi:HSP20 family protein